MKIAGLDDFLADVEEANTLELPYRGRTYRLPQPNLHRMERCVEVWNAHLGDDRATQQAALGEALGDDTIPRLALGADVVEQMEADEVPGVVVTEFAAVALTAWVRGPEVAQKLVDMRVQRRKAAQDSAMPSKTKTKARQSAKKRGA